MGELSLEDTETQLLSKYGVLLSTDNLSEVFHYKNKRSVYEAMYRESFPSTEKPLSVTKIGKHRFAHYKDVAKCIHAHFDDSISS